MLEAGTVVADRFRLVRKLGEGAMGSVWLAHHTQLDVPCALKFILGEGATSPDLRARFEREAKAAAALRSPHVVGILDHGVWEGTPYIAMEYLEGEDLAARLSRLGRLPPADVVNVVAQVARALSKAHAAGLVHRDLKPANIFLARDDDREIAKVLDFGIAKSSGIGIKDAGTKTGALMGTPYYMSPEQGQGTRALDHRSDLWSLAVVVFQCMTGSLPFQSEALGDLLMRIIIQPLPVPSQVAQVPPGFDAWWEKASMRDPSARFQSAREFAEALATTLGLPLGSSGVGAAATAGSGSHLMPAGPSGTIALSSSQPALAASPAAGGFGASPAAGGFGASPAAGGFAASPGVQILGQSGNLPQGGQIQVLDGSLGGTAGTWRGRASQPPQQARPSKRSFAVAAGVGAGVLVIAGLVVWAAIPGSASSKQGAAAAATTASTAVPANATAEPAAPTTTAAPTTAATSVPTASPTASVSSQPTAAPAAPPSASPAVPVGKAPATGPLPAPRAPHPAAPKPAGPKDKDLVRW